MVVMLASNTWARSAVAHGLTRAGRPPDTRFMVTPVIANPFRREVIVDVGERYEKGFIWFSPLPHFRPAGYGVDVNRDRSRRATWPHATPRFAAYLRWSRFPFFVVEPIAQRRARVSERLSLLGTERTRRVVGGVGGRAVGRGGSGRAGRAGGQVGRVSGIARRLDALAGPIGRTGRLE